MLTVQFSLFRDGFHRSNKLRRINISASRLETRMLSEKGRLGGLNNN